MMQRLKFLKGLLFLNCALYVQGAYGLTFNAEKSIYFKIKINYDNQKLRFSPVCNHNKYKNSAWCLYKCILCVYMYASLFINL